MKFLKDQFCKKFIWFPIFNMTGIRAHFHRSLYEVKSTPSSGLNSPSQKRYLVLLTFLDGVYSA